MKGTAIRALLPTLWAFSVALAFCLPLSPVAAQDQNAQIIEISAKKYEYSPSPIHVKAGSIIQLKSPLSTTIMVSKSAPSPMAPNPGVRLVWFFLLRKTAGNLRRERQLRLNFWRKRLAHTRLSVATLADWATEV